MAKKKNWANKVHKQLYIEKVTKMAMNTKEYKEAVAEQQIQSVLNALARFSFTACEYLEMKFGCKKQGMLNFLRFLELRIKETENDEEFFEACDKYFKETYGLDVMRELGMQFAEEEVQ